MHKQLNILIYTRLQRKLLPETTEDRQQHNNEQSKHLKLKTELFRDPLSVPVSPQCPECYNRP